MPAFYKKSISIIILAPLMFALMGCAEDFVEETSVSLSSCSEPTCEAKASEKLELSIGEGLESYIGPDVQVFNVTGKCNDGNYSSTSVSWTLFRSGTQISSGGGASCKDGRFYLLINLGAANKGLSGVSHNLVVELKAIDDGDEIRNISKAKKTLQLLVGI